MGLLYNNTAMRPFPMPVTASTIAGGHMSEGPEGVDPLVELTEFA